MNQYDGTSWTEVAELNTGQNRRYRASSGTQTSALLVSGETLQGVIQC